MEDNFIFLSGRHACVGYENTRQEVYVKIANELNTLGPPKMPSEWMRCFNDMKAKVIYELLYLSFLMNSLQLKIRVAKIERYANLTGGRGSSKIMLTALDEKLLAICNLNSVDSYQQVKKIARPRVRIHKLQSTLQQHYVRRAPRLAALQLRSGARTSPSPNLREPTPALRISAVSKERTEPPQLPTPPTRRVRKVPLGSNAITLQRQTVSLLHQLVVQNNQIITDNKQIISLLNVLANK